MTKADVIIGSVGGNQNNIHYLRIAVLERDTLTEINMRCWHLFTPQFSGALWLWSDRSLRGKSVLLLAGGSPDGEWIILLWRVISPLNTVLIKSFKTIVGVPGILGNIISIFVLTSKDMKNSFNLLLSCLAVIDILFNILAISDYAFFRGNFLSIKVIK